MKYLKFFATIGIVGLILSQSAFAQRPQKSKSAAKLEAERIRKERQAEARFLLVALATDARSFRDQTLRARSLARIADALWEIDVEQGRTLFRKAWEAAEIANKESNERNNVRDGVVSLKREEMNSDSLDSLFWNIDIRKEVLRLLAQRDRALAEEILEKLKESHTETKQASTTADLWGLPDGLQHQLNLAHDLLRDGNTDRALQFADPVLSYITISSLEFLTLLRERNPAAADQRYAAMLASAGNSMTADANTISLLSSYLFTPNNYAIFNTDGGGSFSAAPGKPPANVSPQLRLAFFQTASTILLRPQPPPEQDQSSTGIAGKYMVVRLLLPIFEQYAPRDMAASMRSQLEALNSLVNDAVRRQKTSPDQEETTSEESIADREEALLDEIEHADTSDKRDELYFNLALLALAKDDMKARDYVSKIEKSNFRKQAQAWVDWSLAMSAIRKKNTDVALELNRMGELTHIQRVWILTQAAKLLAKLDRTRAVSLLDTATAEARRIDGGKLDRPRALFAIANASRVVEPARVSEAIFEAVKAANSTDGFTGEDGAIVQRMASMEHFFINPQLMPEFDIAETFGVLANEDYERAVELARGFQAEAPRANATIAIARSILNEKGARVPTP